MPNKVYILVGIPGSGKTTFCNQVLKPKRCVILSSDEYRKKLYGDENVQDNPQKVFSRLYSDMNDALSNHKSVAVDATNMSVKDRKTPIAIAKKYKAEVVAIFFPCTVKDAVERQGYRDREVPQYVIEHMVSKFEYPQKFEGIDRVEYASFPYHPRFSDDSSRINLLLKMVNFNQDTHHHLHTLGNHCRKLSALFSSDMVLSEAGLWHDIGKMYTKTYWREKDDDAHYPNHANWSAYYLAVHRHILEKMLCGDDVDEALFYVNQHMHIRDIVKSEKAVEKYTQLWGKDRYDNLVRFMEKDNEAAK